MIFLNLYQNHKQLKNYKLLYPIFFKTKSETKYLLTILGDNILKKTTKKLHLVYGIL